MGMRRKRREKKKRHLLRNLPLRWSLALYVSVYVVIALVAALSLASMFASLRLDIYARYEEQYPQIAMPGYVVVDVDGEKIDETPIWYYSEPIQNYFSEQDLWLAQFYETMSVISIPLVSVACIGIAAFMFYSRKLKKPLRMLDSASAQIASGDLDFSLQYDNRNEMGKLVASFETMRASLAETNKEMWHMMEQRTRVNAAFAHDLRTPLTVLKGYSEFLMHYVPQGKVDTPKLVDTLHMMNGYIQRLEGYTESMASIQKIEAMAITPEPVSVGALCRQVSSAAAVLVSPLELAVQCGAEVAQVAVDTAIVMQVCENLVANAARYASSKVSIACKVNAGVLIITIGDDGKGFSEDALVRASEPYYREDKEAGGAHFGIGLYICRVLCEKHGGALMLSNTAQGGQVEASFASEYKVQP